MPHSDEFEPDSDREHCRLDMHKVERGEMEAADWFGRWGAKVDAFLRTAVPEDEYEPGELARVEEERDGLETDADNYRTAIAKAVSDFDAMVIDPDETAEALNDRISETIISILENAL